VALAFRLYGKFHWPPATALADNPKIADGVVEIHFDVQEGDPTNARHAWLRWYPKNASDPPPPKEFPTKYLFDDSPEDAIKNFTENRDMEYAVWLNTTTTAAKHKSWLIFRGAFLFEQYRESGDEAVLDVQWPLVTECQYRKNTKVYSVLGICYEDRPLLYFNFHLPFPVRRTSLSGSYNLRAFPFSAVYSLAPIAAELLRIDTLVAGWTKDDLLPTLKQDETKEKDTSFPIKGSNNPADKNKQLGRFGLSEYGRGPGDQFALYNRYSSVTGQYWPKNRQAVVQDILWPYGFWLPYDEMGWLSPTSLGIADSSLRFPPIQAGNGNRSHRSSLIYRATVGPNRAHSTDDSELRADQPDPSKSDFRLQLQLSDELGGRIADGTQFGLKGDAGTEVDGWLSVSSPLSADCELSWEIARESIWSDNRDADWSPAVTIRLHWHEEIKPSANIAAAVAHDKVFQAGLLAHAAYSSQIVRLALSRGEAGVPHSLLPNLAFLPENQKSVRVRFSLYGSPLPASFDGVNLPWGRPPPNDDGEAPWRRPPMRLSLAKTGDLIPNNDDTKPLSSLSLAASEQTFFEVGGVQLNLTLSHDPSWPPSSFSAVDDGPPFFASFAVDTLARKPWKGRLSSLQFTGSTQKDDKLNKAGYLRIGGRGVRAGLGAPVLVYPNGRIAAEFSLAIRTARVEPIGIDVARSDRSERPAPLLIPLQQPPQDGGAALPDKLWLVVTETLSPSQDRRIQADIYEDSQETGDRSYVVLSSEPFTIFRFTHRSLYDRGDASNASVAEYSGDDRIWQYKRVSEYYHYVLPPQAVGESADKPRRLEIHDLLDELETPPRPFLYQKDKNGDDVKDSNGNLIPDDTRRRAVEFRLTPSAEIWIRPSDVERGYFMPESTSYEIFRQNGQYGVGAALGFLRAEFLYGLSVGVDVSKEHSAARGARVAEIEALTGKLTGPARETNAEARLSARWNALRNAVARRPERLEVWARDLDSRIDFTPARFSDGAQFALRSTALHRAPVVDQPEGKADYEALPKAALTDQSAPFPRYHPQGLSGGALWPVESLNLFKSLLTAPQSSGGAIESIALSPTGGDATQKAEFLGGKVRIISETRNGYVQRQQVEVLGRICAFWHRAKHVVVYERTVNLPAQFAPKKSEDPKRTRSRRPILRKVREYIELLQPERNYPDFTTAAQRSAGFLERVRFNSKIINVDSAWSSDVDEFGWQIPLWNRLSARERPQVYPMPDIVFVSTCEGAGEKPVVAQECLDPDYLYFFADVSPTTSADTDTWDSRLDLDFPNMPIAKAIADKADQKSSQRQDDNEKGFETRRPPVGRILPGLRRFTWRLAPAAQKAAINAARADKPVYAGLDSVSFMRATHADDAQRTLPGNLSKSLSASISVPLRSHVEQTLSGVSYWKADGTGTSVEDAGKLRPIKEKLTTSINTKDKHLLDEARAELTDLLTPADPTKSFGKKIATAVLPDGLKLDSFKDISSSLAKGRSFCSTLKTDAVGMIRRKEMLIRSALEDWTRKSDDFVNKAILFKNDVDKKATKDNAIDNLQTLAIDYIRPLFDEASKDIGKVEEGVEKANAALIDLETEIEAVIDRARQRIAQFVNGYDHAKPWSPERRQAFRSGISACVGNISNDVSAAIEETRHRLGVELSDVSQAIGGHIAKALRAIETTEAEATAQISSLKGTADALYFNIDRTLARLQDDANAAQLDQLITKVQGQNLPDTLKKNVVNALKGLKDACKATKGTIGDARGAAAAVDRMADDSADSLGSLTSTLGTTLKNAIEGIKAPVQNINSYFQALVDEQAQDIANAFRQIFNEVDQELQDIAKWPDHWIQNIGKPVDAVVGPATQFLDAQLADLKEHVRGVPQQVEPVIADVKSALKNAQDALAPKALLESVVATQVIRPALVSILEPLPATIETPDIDEALANIKRQLLLLSDTLGNKIRNLKEGALGALDQVSSACNLVFEGVDQAEALLTGLANNAAKYIDDKLAEAQRALQSELDKVVGNTFPDDVKGLVTAVESFDYSVRSMQNNAARAYETARAYGDRVFNQFSKLGGGGVLAAPSNVLKLYSAVTTAPEIAALKADIDRIRSSYDELSDIVQTTKANALFNRLGDELKALGLSLPFDKIGDRLIPANLSDFNIGKVFRNFGGTKLDNLLKGYSIPSGVSDAVRVTHDFDKKQARAWVQVDIDAPMAGRRSLFSIGVFKADFVDMRLTGQVRLDASKDQDKVTETGYGRIGTMIDLVVGGQSMVRFEKFALNFTRESGLKVEFDPKNIRLNPSFQFIQDFLGTLFPDKVGGLEIIKQDGIPVGVQHTFALPPMALNFGTSGVSNISIANHFKLLAFPDFMLANRFNLSTVERPFIFSIFIIGGTGYIQIEAEYRPFDGELSVTVEAGAGGSASLAFAFGPFVGQVFITLSGALAYRKVIGKPGGGLSISAVLVIAGYVDVCGIVTVGIVLMLRMTYRDSGQIDADGTLTVEIRISKFFKITARAGVTYKMRGGKSETTTSTDVSAEPTDPALQKLQTAAKTLEAARH
jgi:hypothetical protein